MGILFWLAGVERYHANVEGSIKTADLPVIMQFYGKITV
jgi:hypothetical protein